jgi:hypothetical protein
MIGILEYLIVVAQLKYYFVIDAIYLLNIINLDLIEMNYKLNIIYTIWIMQMILLKFYYVINALCVNIIVKMSIHGECPYGLFISEPFRIAIKNEPPTMQ